MIGLMIRSRRDLVCQQAVELVTDYLDGVLSAVPAPPLRGAPGGLPGLPRVPGPDERVIVLAGSITADDLTPHMRSESHQPVPAMASR